MTTLNANGTEWPVILAFSGARLARLTAELEQLGDPDLRNFEAPTPASR